MSLESFHFVLDIFHNSEFLSRFTTVNFYVLIALLFSLEFFFPAKSNQKIFSVGMLEDFMGFMFVQPLIRIFIVTLYVYFLKLVFETWLGWHPLTIFASLASWQILVIGFIVKDFLHWVIHSSQHKFYFLWYFHAMHHSQREMSLFTDERTHIVDHLGHFIVQGIPLYFLSISLDQFILFSLFDYWYAKFYHANIKTNLGWLKYFIVTPQYHRIHHSIEEKHFDKNFADYLTIWDRIFGTQYQAFHEYPDTGIDDNQFPLEKNRQWLSLIKTAIQQQVYPFKQLLTVLKKSILRISSSKL